MNLFWKAIVLALVSALLGLQLNGIAREYVLLVSLAATIILFTAIHTFLEPVIAFFSRLAELSSLDNGSLLILVKAFGISITGEMACSLCSDTGNSALAKTVQMLTGAAILYLSLPVFSSLLDLLQNILGNL